MPAVNLVHLTLVNIILIMVVPNQSTCAGSKPSAPDGDPGKNYANHCSQVYTSILTVFKFFILQFDCV